MIRFNNISPASVPTPPTDKTTLFVDSSGQPSIKDDTGTVYLLAGQPIPKGYIDGMKMEWVSGTQIRTTTGTVYIPSLNAVLEFPAALTKTPTLATNTWYHGYAFLNGTTPDVEWVTTAPSAPYFGTARTKTGDTSRRYIGSFRTMLASSAIAKFNHDQSAGDIITYLDSINGPPYLVVSSGSATTATTVSCSAAVPPTSRQAKLLANNNATGQFVYMSNSTATNPLDTNFWLSLITPGSSFYATFPLDTAQAFNYMYNAAPSGGQVFIRVVGYTYER